MVLIKWAGGLLVFAACSALGFYRAFLLGRRVRWIRESMHGVQRLETEIAFASTPLLTALVKPVLAGAPVSDSFFAVLRTLLLKQAAERRGAGEVDVRAVWLELCGGRLYPFSARREELQIMRELGVSLGISDRDDQIKHLRLTSHQLASLAEDALVEQQKYESMWRSFGVLGGLLLVILFV